MNTGATLRGIERLAVFNRLRAAVGLRCELPPLVKSAALPSRPLCLEIGTGLGWGTVGLLRMTGSRRVVTTDYEGAILHRARAFVHEKQPGSHVDYLQVDAKELPFASARFDVVLSLYVLHHAAGYRAVLAEIARVLRPGGCLLMIDLIRPAFLPQLPTGGGIVARFRSRVAPDGILTKSEWQHLFVSSGFVIERWQTSYTRGPLPRCNVVARRMAERARLYLRPEA